MMERLLSMAALFNRPSHTNHAYTLAYGDDASDCGKSKEHINTLRTSFARRFGKPGAAPKSFALGTAVAA